MKKLGNFLVCCGAFVSVSALGSESIQERAQAIFFEAVRQELQEVNSISFEKFELALIPRGGGAQYLVEANVDGKFHCSAAVEMSRSGESVISFPDALAPLCSSKSNRSSISASNRHNPLPPNTNPTQGRSLSCFSINRDLPTWNVEVSAALPDGSHAVKVVLTNSVLTETFETTGIPSNAGSSFLGDMVLVGLGKLSLLDGSNSETRSGSITLKNNGIHGGEVEPLACTLK